MSTVAASVKALLLEEKHGEMLHSPLVGALIKWFGEVASIENSRRRSDSNMTWV